jgi:hypothetical protein
VVSMRKDGGIGVRVCGGGGGGGGGGLDGDSKTYLVPLCMHDSFA